jgi:hypothetical protein
VNSFKNKLPKTQNSSVEIIGIVVSSDYGIFVKQKITRAK